MAEDPDTGIDPVAKDGEPNDDEVSKRRAAKNGGGSVADRSLAEEQAKLDAEDGKAEPEIAEADDGQLFVWEQGRKVTLGTLIARGVPVEHAFVFGGKRVKGSGGLMSFDESPLMIVSSKPGAVRVVPKRDDDDKVIKVTVESHVDTRVVHPADSEAGLAMISHILDTRGFKRTTAA